MPLTCHARIRIRRILWEDGFHASFVECFAQRVQVLGLHEQNDLE